MLRFSHSINKKIQMFTSLPLAPQILKALSKAGYEKPTEIQQQAIPPLLEGHDLRGCAQTGTGKTAAFLLPALQRLVEPLPKKEKGARVLILAPTRELAMQIAKQAEKYSAFLPHLNTVTICGGIPFPVQKRKLAKPFDLLIATPGRLLDAIERKKISLSRVELLILDEADRMLDMGFFEPVMDIANAAPADKQTVLFSATFDKNIVRLSEKLLKDPLDIVVKGKNKAHEKIEQILHYVDDMKHKTRLLDIILQDEDVADSIIFTSTKRSADQLAEKLSQMGHQAAAMHGDMSQKQRTRTIQQMKRGKLKTLVATDVAARGIDVPSISHVINFDLPRNTEDYVHRIGRTARAGADGIALSFATFDEQTCVKKIEEYIDTKINVQVIEGHEPTKKPSIKKKGPPRGRKKPFFQARSNHKKRPFPRRKKAVASR